VQSVVQLEIWTLHLALCVAITGMLVFVRNVVIPDVLNVQLEYINAQHAVIMHSF
jgi:hypothetical protein